MGASGGSEREHDNLWAEMTKVRERSHKAEAAATRALFESEKCHGISTRLNEQEVEIVKIGKDIAAVVKAHDDLKSSIDRLLSRFAWAVGIVVTVITAVSQLLWWLFQQLPMKVG